MKITREEDETGGPNRTRQETIVPLVTAERLETPSGPRGTEDEDYIDASESEGWPWNSDSRLCTWELQLDAIHTTLDAFNQLDSMMAAEQADGDDEEGGSAAYIFSNVYMPLGAGPDGQDLNLTNWKRKWEAFYAKYWNGRTRPPFGGTQIMEAVKAGDKHYLGEFGPGGKNEMPRAQRPVRIRKAWTDGALQDAEKFQRYLSEARLTPVGLGGHGEWDELWAIIILGEEGGGGHAAHQQYQRLAKDHPWIHPYYFESVKNAAEIAEDVTIACAPGITVG